MELPPLPRVKVKTSLKKSKVSLAKVIQPQSDVEEGEIMEGLDDGVEILDELIVTNVVRKKAKKEKLIQIEELSSSEDDSFPLDHEAEESIVQTEKESEDLAVKGVLEEFSEGTEALRATSEHSFNPLSRKKFKKSSTLAQSELKDKVPKMKIRASKGVKAVSLKEYDDSEGGSANEIDRLNEREIELRDLIKRSQASLDTIKLQKLKLQSNNLLGSKSLPTKEKKQPTWTGKHYQQLRAIVMKQPNFDRLEIELDWSQITRIMNEKGDYATPVESALVQKYGKRLRKREVLKKESNAKPQIRVLAEKASASQDKKSRIVVKEVGVFEKVRGFFGF